MGNVLPTSVRRARPSGPRLLLETVREDLLDLEEMTKAPPDTMRLVARTGCADGAYTNGLPWPEYILDAWYTSDLAP